MTAPMSPHDKAAALRAARASAAGRPADRVPMGIRYLNVPTRPAQPAPARPLWMDLAPSAQLVDVAEPAPRRRARTAARATTAAPAATPKTSTPAPTRPATAPPAHRETPAPPPAEADPLPRVLSSHDAYACEACGSRYRYPADDHGCGPLTPVTVTVTTAGRYTTTVGGRVLASYDARQCEACGDRDPVGAHGCGPLTAVTVTITARTAGGRS